MKNSNNHCLTDEPFNLQYKKLIDGSCGLNQDLYNEHQYFLDGLTELQKINPKLTFYGGELAMEYFKSANNQPTLSPNRPNF